MEVGLVRQQHQRERAKPLQSSGDGNHVPQVLDGVTGRVMGHHHESPTAPVAAREPPPTGDSPDDRRCRHWHRRWSCRQCRGPAHALQTAELQHEVVQQRPVNSRGGASGNVRLSSRTAAGAAWLPGTAAHNSLQGLAVTRQVRFCRRCLAARLPLEPQELPAQLQAMQPLLQLLQQLGVLLLLPLLMFQLALRDDARQGRRALPPQERSGCQASQGKCRHPAHHQAPACVLAVPQQSWITGGVIRKKVSTDFHGTC
mmetsp:Transcript_86680/g.240372  ORF Transcript_86680/g.240372 Transcript_86680/m.240372 type:complete len:257 (+) Transcript_86680:956-1726(+)